MIPAGCKRFITTYQPIAGWKAIQYWWNDQDIPGQGFWEPWETGMCGWATEAEAIAEAQMWADNEGLPYISREEAG